MPTALPGEAFVWQSLPPPPTPLAEQEWEVRWWMEMWGDRVGTPEKL